MSIDALPSELDNRILALLDHDALNAMSKTSKTYRGVSEPFLYRRIKFTASHDVSMRWLVVTILHRPNLAAHIRTVNFSEDHRTRGDSVVEAQRKSESSALLEQAIVKLHRTIQTTLGSETGKAEIRVSWMGAVLADNHVEGSLALIVCLAYNIECLTIMGAVGGGVTTGYYGHLLTSIMWEAFNHFYSEPSGSLQDSRPFQRLQNFHIKSSSPTKIITLPHLRTIRVENSDEVSISHLFPTNTSHDLHTLEIVDTYCSAKHIQAMFSEHHATELRRLILRGFSAVPDRSCQPILDALIENCHKLEYLELNLLPWFADEIDRPLTGFGSLVSLSTLRIDLDVLIDLDNPSSFLQLNKLLPPNLRALHITGVPEWEFWSFVDRFYEPGINNLQFFAESYSIRFISITIDFEEGSDAEYEWRFIKDRLAHVATLLWAKNEISLQIYKSVQGYGTAPKLIFDREGFHDEAFTFEESETEESEVEEPETEGSEMEESEMEEFEAEGPAI